MIIKMVNEFTLTVVHSARPNLMQICAYAWIYCWTKNRKLGPGIWASRLSQAMGHWLQACF